MTIRPPTRKVPCCTSCYIGTPEHRYDQAKQNSFLFSGSVFEGIKWPIDAPTRLCWVCGYPTTSGLRIDNPGRARRKRIPFCSLARLRLRKGTR